MILNNDRDHQGVVVGMSGGVDSAVAALLLQAEGYDVHGVTLKLWRASEAEIDTTPAVRVAEHLDIPLTERNLKEQFYHRVVEPFVDAYAQGRTPNPCVFCNPILKFEALLAEAERIGAAWIATGHYARVIHRENAPTSLLRARAVDKDQSYALYRLTQRHLRRLLLPLGDLESKDAVRAHARAERLPSAEVPDSQDLCFMAGSDYRSLLAEVRPTASTPGPIYNDSGEQIGEHVGLASYTVGQRSGLGIASSERLYVLELDPRRNALIVGPRSQLARHSCRLRHLSFLEGQPPASKFQAEGRIRYRAKMTAVEVVVNGDEAMVTFATPQYGVAPGQSLVLYAGERLLGGGVIVTRTDAAPDHGNIVEEDPTIK